MDSNQDPNINRSEGQMITAAAKSGRSSLSLTCGLPQEHAAWMRAVPEDPATRHAHRREGQRPDGFTVRSASQTRTARCLPDLANRAWTLFKVRRKQPRWRSL